MSAQFSNIEKIAISTTHTKNWPFLPSYDHKASN